MDRENWQAEAVCFSRYLIGQTPKKQARELYVQAAQTRDQQLPSNERHLIQFALRHPWSIGYLDAGLAMSRPDAELRQRLYLMFSILETVPEYADEFLPNQHSRFFLFVVGWSACRASFKALAGWLLVKLAA